MINEKESNITSNRIHIYITSNIQKFIVLVSMSTVK